MTSRPLLDPDTEAAFAKELRELARSEAICKCNAYPFPHREASGKCKGQGWCDRCGAGTVFRGSGGACYSYQWQECPECGWNNR